MIDKIFLFCLQNKHEAEFFIKSFIECCLFTTKTALNIFDQMLISKSNTSVYSQNTHQILYFLIYKRQKSHLIITEHSWMSSRYAIVYTFLFFNLFWMKVSRSLTIRNHDKKKKYWLDKALQASVENFYFYCDNSMTEKFNLNHLVRI